MLVSNLLMSRWSTLCLVHVWYCGTCLVIFYMFDTMVHVWYCVKCVWYCLHVYRLLLLKRIAFTVLNTDNIYEHGLYNVPSVHCP